MSKIETPTKIDKSSMITIHEYADGDFYSWWYVVGLVDGRQEAALESLNEFVIEFAGQGEATVAQAILDKIASIPAVPAAKYK